MWHELLRALALIMVIEGLIPFLAPHRFRAALLRLMALDERVLRTVGFASVLIGLLILQALRWLF